MPSPECKVYFDGSHYIAIPHTTRRYKPRRRQNEEKIAVKPPAASGERAEGNAPAEAERPAAEAENLTPIELIARGGTPVGDAPSPPAAANILNENGDVRVMTKRELFNEIYRECVYMKYGARKERLISAMRPYFKSDDAAKTYVESNLARKKRNLIARRVRLTRKANLQEFNYFVTLTYDGAIHTEETFRKQLKNCLALFCHRKGWKYIGVWERSPEKQRLHFHGIFHIPEGTMPGFFCEVEDYNFKSHRRTKTNQNSYFKERFGRCDFEKIEDAHRIGDALAYLMKYIEKSGEKIVYSKGLPQFFISDILDDDVVCPIGMEDKKMLLFDDFSCFDEGEYIGTVSKETIERLRKSP